MKRGDLKNGDVFRYANEDYGVARHIGDRDMRTPIPTIPSHDHGTDADLTAEVVLLWRPEPKPLNEAQRRMRLQHIMIAMRATLFMYEDGELAKAVKHARDVVDEVYRQEGYGP